MTPLQAPDARRIPLTNGAFAIVDAEDFERLSRCRWYLKGLGEWERYAVRNAPRPGGGQRPVLMQNEVLGYDGLIDHVNRDSLDNRRINLRPATRAQNTQNRSRFKNNTSGFKGVSREPPGRQGWRARIGLGGKKFLGHFDDPIAAACAYNAAAVELFGEFACLNRMD